MREFIRKVKYTYSIENIKYRFGINPTLTVVLLGADALLVVGASLLVLWAAGVI